ncbi:MAG: mycofactocin biosynthesis peptidyl-dipeptidase MftE [Geodermatophilaceae bacterium]|nr:mycofactocin biosynthesis peptidyl-dipeptidase MftE [Geodermatophilaceae bacterium]
MRTPRSVEGLTWADLREPGTTLVVPLGSLEQHGHHLPLDTDSALAVHLAATLCTARPTLVLAPVLPYGASGEHEGFPGTVSIGHEALELVLVELGRSASRWASRLLVVNGHGGNVAALAAAVERLRYEGRDAASWTAGWRTGDSHAGRTETSLMLALRPDSVRLAHAVPGATEPLGELMPRLRADGVSAVSPSGVLGDPTGASAAEGIALLAEMAVRLGAAVDAWLAAGAPVPR